jgi:hypothetical protein
MPGERRPGLRFEVATGNRMLLRQRDEVVFFARVHPRNYGIDVHRTGAYESPLAPTPAELARRFANSEQGSPAWLDRWSHHFATGLVAAERGPLHGGTWALKPRALPAYCLTADLVADFPDAHLDWFGQGWNGLLPLRELAHRDSARVKAYRKQANDGLLAPIVLWWASGLDGYLLLDGHSRLVAAQAEQIRPEVLVLSLSAASEPDDDRRTRAWPVTGGAEAWERDASRG